MMQHFSSALGRRQRLGTHRRDSFRVHFTGGAADLADERCPSVCVTVSIDRVSGCSSAAQWCSSSACFCECSAAIAANADIFAEQFNI